MRTIPNEADSEKAAGELLRRHGLNQAEANITSAVRDFLRATSLLTAEEMEEEQHPAPDSAREIDLVGEAFFEIKARIGGPGGGLNPTRKNVEQLDDYIESAHTAGITGRMGVLTDGKHWVLRWRGASPQPLLAYPYAFTLESAEQWVGLYEWLRDNALITYENEYPDRDRIALHFGPQNAAYAMEIAGLRLKEGAVRRSPAFETKRLLWETLLTTALGDPGLLLADASGRGGLRKRNNALAQEIEAELDDLFLRHTYLSIVVALIVQARFGIDIREVAENNPLDLISGQTFRDRTGIQGIIEPDFFSWPAETNGGEAIRDIARRVARFDWLHAPADIGATLYESVIPADERRKLGEYYTPAWLAKAIVAETVHNPLKQRVLDPSCGSGTFIVEAVQHFLSAAARSDLAPADVLKRLTEAVTGIDIHPVAVQLARTAWLLAAKPAIDAVVASGGSAPVSVPVYLGDSLLLRFRGLRVGDMISDTEARIPIDEGSTEELIFPRSLVDRASAFDLLMTNTARAIERGENPLPLIDSHGVLPHERAVVETALKLMQRLHGEGRNHIWAYYTRNLVRPLVLMRKPKRNIADADLGQGLGVDVIVGNPPWINYNKTDGLLRDELVRLSQREYGIWAGGHYATQQDVASLFYARCIDLYLKDGGVIGMVMPHSALLTGQHAKWRTGEWKSTSGGKGFTRILAVHFSWKAAWDLERLEPNSFFPVPACVVFAKRAGMDTKGSPLTGSVERWSGKAGAPNPERVPVALGTANEGSPYSRTTANGATIFPRRLFLVDEVVSTVVLEAEPLVTVQPRMGSQDKMPWKDLNLNAITGNPIEQEYLVDVHLGETLGPYALLPALKALLPLCREPSGRLTLPLGDTGGLDAAKLRHRMGGRWRAISSLWEGNRGTASKLSLLEQLDYYGKLSAQLEWQADKGNTPVRVIYSGSGRPTAALLADDTAFVDYTLFTTFCRDTAEANYLLAIINSDALYARVAPLMPKGQFGARHVQKHLWKLPIPTFDAGNALHAEIAGAGEAAAKGAAAVYDKLRERYADTPEKLTVTLVRRSLREWLAESGEGRAVESAVSRLLRG